MEITRNIILDLLPLFLAGEASQDTQDLVNQFLEADPDLAEMAKRAAVLDQLEEIPPPLRKDQQMEAYKEAQRAILQRTIIIGAVIAFVVLTCLGMALLVYFMLVPVT